MIAESPRVTTSEIKNCLFKNQENFYTPLKIYAGPARGRDLNPPYNLFRPGEYNGESNCLDSSVLLSFALKEAFEDLDIYIVGAEVLRENPFKINGADRFDFKKHYWLRLPNQDLFIDSAHQAINPQKELLVLDSLANEKDYFKFLEYPKDLTKECIDKFNRSWPYIPKIQRQQIPLIINSLNHE